MTELLERKKKRAEPREEETPRRVRVPLSRLFGVALAAIIFATGVGLFAFNGANGADGSPAEAAEARAEAMVEIYEGRWLEDLANIAKLRAEAMVEVYESRWLADPANIAWLRAQDMVQHYENLWRTRSG